MRSSTCSDCVISSRPARPGGSPPAPAAAHRPGDDLPQNTRAVTAAGVTLAVSFGLLALVPLAPFRELAFAMAVGMLLDAVVVRSLLIPALLTLVGPASGLPGAHLRPYRSATASRPEAADPGPVPDRSTVPVPVPVPVPVRSAGLRSGREHRPALAAGRSGVTAAVPAPVAVTAVVTVVVAALLWWRGGWMRHGRRRRRR